MVATASLPGSSASHILTTFCLSSTLPWTSSSTAGLAEDSALSSRRTSPTLSLAGGVLAELWTSEEEFVKLKWSFFIPFCETFPKILILVGFPAVPSPRGRKCRTEEIWIECIVIFYNSIIVILYILLYYNKIRYILIFTIRYILLYCPSRYEYDYENILRELYTKNPCIK